MSKAECALLFGHLVKLQPPASQDWSIAVRINDIVYI